MSGISFPIYKTAVFMDDYVRFHLFRPLEKKIRTGALNYLDKPVRVIYNGNYGSTKSAAGAGYPTTLPPHAEYQHIQSSLLSTATFVAPRAYYTQFPASLSTFCNRRATGMKKARCSHVFSI